MIAKGAARHQRADEPPPGVSQPPDRGQGERAACQPDAEIGEQPACRRAIRIELQLRHPWQQRYPRSVDNQRGHQQQHEERADVVVPDDEAEAFDDVDGHHAQPGTGRHRRVEGARGDAKRHHENQARAHQDRLQCEVPLQPGDRDSGASKRRPHHLRDRLSGAVQGDRVHKPVRRYHRRNERLPDRLPHCHPRPHEQRHPQRDPQGHEVDPDQDRRQRRPDQHDHLAHDEQHPPVPAIGEDPRGKREEEHRDTQREGGESQVEVPRLERVDDQPGEGEALDALHQRVAEVVRPEKSEVAYLEGRERLEADPPLWPSPLLAARYGHRNPSAAWPRADATPIRRPPTPGRASPGATASVSVPVG